MKDMDAMHELGAWAAQSKGNKAMQRAERYYRRAAKRGHSESAYELAMMAIVGEISPRPPISVVRELVQSAAEDGCLPAEELWRDWAAIEEHYGDDAEGGDGVGYR